MTQFLPWCHIHTAVWVFHHRAVYWSDEPYWALLDGNGKSTLRWHLSVQCGILGTPVVEEALMIVGHAGWMALIVWSRPPLRWRVTASFPNCWVGVVPAAMTATSLSSDGRFTVPWWRSQHRVWAAILSSLAVSFWVTYSLADLNCFTYGLHSWMASCAHNKNAYLFFRPLFEAWVRQNSERILGYLRLRWIVAVYPPKRGKRRPHLRAVFGGDFELGQPLRGIVT